MPSRCPASIARLPIPSERTDDCSRVFTLRRTRCRKSVCVSVCQTERERVVVKSDVGVGGHPQSACVPVVERMRAHAGCLSFLWAFSCAYSKFIKWDDDDEERGRRTDGSPVLADFLGCVWHVVKIVRCLDSSRPRDIWSFSVELRWI